MQKIVLAIDTGKHFRLDKNQLDIGRYSSGEILLGLREKVEGKEVFIIGSTNAPAENFVQMILATDTARKKGAAEITTIIPYLSYSRADREKFEGDSVSVETVARILETVGGPNLKIVTFDMHSSEGKNYFNVPFFDLSAINLFLKNVADKSDLTIVAPDSGAAERAVKFAEILRATSVAEANKERLKNGEVSIKGITGKIGGKALIIDDIVDTGETVLKVAKYLKTVGVQKIVVVSTHTIWTSSGYKRISEDSTIEGFITTNSIKPPDDLSEKIKIVDITPLIKKVIYG